MILFYYIYFLMSVGSLVVVLFPFLTMILYIFSPLDQLHKSLIKFIDLLKHPNLDFTEISIIHFYFCFVLLFFIVSFLLYKGLTVRVISFHEVMGRSFIFTLSYMTLELYLYLTAIYIFCMLYLHCHFD